MRRRKVVLLLAAIITVIIATTAWWWQGQLEDAKAAQVDGVKFAMNRDSTACVDEVVARAKNVGISGSYPLHVFLVACLRTAKFSDGFCDGVPVSPRSEIQLWQKQLNQKYDIAGVIETAILPSGILTFCWELARTKSDCFGCT
jgi:hypothetical protein